MENYETCVFLKIVDAKVELFLTHVLIFTEYGKLNNINFDFFVYFEFILQALVYLYSCFLSGSLV